MADLEEENDSPDGDVVPPLVIQTLTVLWIALFGGRWIGVSLLQWNGFLSPDRVADLDSGVLTRLYLILLVLTILIVVMRGARRLTSQTQNAEKSDAAAKFKSSGPISPTTQPRQEHRKRD